MKRNTRSRASRPSFASMLARLRPRWIAALVIVLAVGGWTSRSDFIGQGVPASLSVCEETTDDEGNPRPECLASDIRFDAQLSGGAGQFGFSMAIGLLNGDDLEDLAVGDPQNNRVYIYFGRPSTTSAYGLASDVLARGVPATNNADVVLFRDPAIPNQVGSFGFSLAVGRETTNITCPPNGRAVPLLIGAPGQPGTTGNAPGTAFYLPPGALCEFTPTDPPTPLVIDPDDVGQDFQAFAPAPDDEFGYSVGFGRIHQDTAAQEDAIIGARNALGGAGRVEVRTVDNGLVSATQVLRIDGRAGENLGESLASGDLDGDFDEDDNPNGAVDDLAAGAVGDGRGKVLLVRGPLATGRVTEGNVAVRSFVGEGENDFFGFSVAIGANGLGIGAIFADNDPPTDDGGGGDPATNVRTARRLNAGKVYLFAQGILDSIGDGASPNLADVVLVARRSGDQLGFAIDFGNLNGTGEEDLVVTARREDGNGVEVDQIDQGTAYVIYDNQFLPSPIDLSLCAPNADCTGVSGVDVMVFGGDRQNESGDELGFAVAVGNFNPDNTDDLFVSSMTRNRVYAIALDDADNDRLDFGRNLRDDDDDNDEESDATDCEPLDELLNSGAEEIPCNDIDENCNGMEDDRPDLDNDGFDACGTEEIAPDCDDEDPASFPGGFEQCDGNDNDCDGSLEPEELDIDSDGFVECPDFDDVQGDDPDILGGGDCSIARSDIFPGAAPNEANDQACMKDTDEDGFGDSSPPAGVIAGTDCDDASSEAAVTFPGAAPNDSPVACMSDEDGDDWGDLLPRAGVTPGTDCIDTDPGSFPGATEVCDGNDNDCDTDTPGDELDDDADGFVECADWNDVQQDDPSIFGGGDCNDDSSTTFPGASPNESDPGACTKDADGDSWGDIDPPAGAVPGSDCDDDSPLGIFTFPGSSPNDSPTNCMRDADRDDWADDSVDLPIVAGSDCDDADALLFPGALETPDDGIDQDCNGGDTITCFVDSDGDGFGSTTTILAADGDCDDPGESAVDTDCDDSTTDIAPGRAEIVGDGIDQDCSGSDSINCFVDSDQDGFGGAPGVPVVAADGSCDADQQESLTANDCDDADGSTFPGAPQLCDGNDNTCAGTGVPVDELDGDGDRFVSCSGWNDSQGDDPTILGGDDCDDSSSVTFPGSADREPLSAACMKDEDDDGFGDLAPPAGVSPGGDCDDESPLAAFTFPGAAPNDAPLNCLRDVDGDGYGDTNVDLPIVAGTDCDDTDVLTFLGAPESCDGNNNACGSGVPADEIDADGDFFVACSDWNDAQGDQPMILGGGDCDESSDRTFPGVASNESFAEACMRDLDGDGYGELSPPGGVTPGTDCDDASLSAMFTFPGAAQIEAPFNCMRDVDDDGYGDSAAALPIVAGTDCADTEAGQNPGTQEGPQGNPTCSDGIDNDCDGSPDGADPVCAGSAQLCPDADGDNFADCTTDPNCDATGLVCGDCDDSLSSIRPGATETCNNLDDNCNNLTDEGFDGDGDGFTVCDLPEPDCNDGDMLINPGVLEVCGDAIDNDCDAATADLFDGDNDGAACNVDCDDDNQELNLDDVDGDTFTTCDGDCNDDQGSINPDADEVCDDGIDNDCNPATLDLGDADNDGALCDVDCDDTDPSLNLDDADGDTFSTCGGDCNDDVGTINPSATESCDGIDNDCIDGIDNGFDLDGDGFTVCDLPVPDCNDDDMAVNPGADEVCNDAIDNDCDAATPDIGDGDMDGFNCDVDCNDADDTSFPGATEVCDGNDNSCSGSIPADEIDNDLDGFVECSGFVDTQLDNPELQGGDDCDTTQGDTFPGAAPNETNPAGCFKDSDGDGFGALDPPSGVDVGTDCDDASLTAASTFPGAAEIDAPLNCMRDVDNDGYGDEAVTLPIVAGNDCDDTMPAINPGVTEGPSGDPVCSDTFDNDCDDQVDASDPGCSAPTSMREFKGMRQRPTKRLRNVGKNQRGPGR